MSLITHWHGRPVSLVPELIDCPRATEQSVIAKHWQGNTALGEKKKEKKHPRTSSKVCFAAEELNPFLV